MIKRKQWGKRKNITSPLLYLMIMLSICFITFQPSKASPSEEFLQIRSPLSNVWVKEKKLFVTGSVTLDVKNVAVKRNGFLTGTRTVPVDRAGFEASVTLKKGLNTITVSAGEASTTLSVYYSPTGKNIPNGFARYYLHKDQTPLNCEECHKSEKETYDFKHVIPSPANCTQCHTKMTGQTHVHGPVGAGVCISCHSPHGSTVKLMLINSDQELCFFCHQSKKEEFQKKVVHAPVEEGCVDCHDPHQSNMRFQLHANGDSVSGLCFTCHDKDVFSRSVQHGPVAEGDCLACHHPHASENEKLLITPTTDGKLCFECHDDHEEDFSKKTIHAPVEDGCGECHDPHSSDAEFQLHEPVGKLCASCHEDMHPEVYEAKNNGVFKHEPVDQNRCTACHNPHASDYEPLLLDRMDKMCTTCHEEMGEILVNNKYRHGPIRNGKCADCHNVHGSQYSRLLTRYFPKQFYGEYIQKKYDLCFGCHDEKIAQKKLTTSLTGFRDGDYNLHFFHVNMKKGRSCIACHDPHASNQAQHLRHEVPYGAWSYPISYTKTKNGGTCVVGCHAPKTYDRKKPKLRARSR